MHVNGDTPSARFMKRTMKSTHECCSTNGDRQCCCMTGGQAGAAARASAEWGSGLALPEHLVNRHGWNGGRRHQEPQQPAARGADRCMTSLCMLLAPELN